MGILAIRCATGIVGMLLVGFPSSPLTADDSTPQLRWNIPVEAASDQTSLADADPGSEFSFRKNLAGNPFDTDKASSDSFEDFRLLGGNPEAGQSIQRVSLILLSIQAEPGSQLASPPDSKAPTETVDQPPGNVMLLNTPPPSPRRVPAEGQTERPGNRVAARRQADEGRGTQERSGQAQPDEVLRPVPSPTTPGRAADPPQAPATGQTPSPVTTGDTTPEIQVTPPLTAEVVASRRTAMEQRTDLSEEVKLQALKNYQQAIELLSQKADADKRYAEQKNQKETGPALIADVKAQLEQPAIRPEPDFPPDSSVAELDQLRLADEELASEARRGLEEWETKAKIRAERRPQMPALIESTRKSLEEAEKAFRSPAPEGENPVLTQSRQTQQEAMVMLLKSQLEQYRVEQMRYEALNELFPLQRDLLLRNRNAYEKRLESWKAILTEARREETARQAREAREKLQNAHPRLRSLAERNAELVARRRALQEFLTEKSTDLTAISGKLTSVEEQFENVNKKNRVRLTTALGVLLRNQRNQLPDADDYYDIRLEAEEDLVRLQTEQMQLTDERNDLGDIETQVSAVLADQTNLAGTIEQQQVSTDGFASEDLRQMAYELLTDRRKYLDDLLADYSTGLQTLGETDVACRRLESLIQQFEAYIDERVLWIRSASAVGIGFPAKTIETARSFIWHPEWVPLIMFIISDAQESWIEYALLLAVLGVLVGFRRRMKSTIATLGVTAQKQTGSGIPQTLLATLLTIIMASVWSVILWFIGWRLGKCDLDLASAMSDAFQFAARWLWNVNSFRGLCRQNGVAQSFLEWPESIVQSLKRNLLLYIAGALPLAFIVVASDKVDQGTASDSVGRLAFVLYSLLLATILRRLVNPNGSVIGDLLRSRPGSLMYRLRWLWYPVAIGAPLCLAVLALMGYQYTAEELMMRLQMTIGLSIVLLIIYTMMMQWMLAARRDLAMKQAKAKRAAAIAARESESENSAGTTLPPIEEPHIDLSTVNQQMLRLVRATLIVIFFGSSWAIWGQVLPALQVFSRFELWQVVVEFSETIDDGVSTPTVQEISRVESITLGHMLLAVIALIGAVVAGRNVPGLLELAVLQRLPIDQGGRHAITTLCRYIIMLSGIIFASNTIGVSWGSVQWLVAALTVGLGFGLQEIFANFVSGLIILFERPVRIGDVVTIDGVSGCVTRIHIRATTITDWDRKEYIVPNREFVTGKLLNWTLSDKTNRIVINVGIAYGSDTEQALALLLKVAEDHPLILSDPPPVVAFEGFGDSCLNLVLRCFLPNLDQRLAVISQLHVDIDRAYRAADIEMAFPQRDLHIRSLPAGLEAAIAARTARPVIDIQTAASDSVPEDKPQT